ncbi:endonuclease/exonuclease/phosphatase family protein [Nocardiopsis sp. CC223A]|uniref:endonuclease/exonuclease/phosphatase family protein n=1 Tax=Nocardiopsis sp. CC223A TaxID=3044051 RepID=UPI00278C7DC1|nr:endonuclease/exonuclease/phosphatase family protein [Nocardiopsis sp. CC223A]
MTDVNEVVPAVRPEAPEPGRRATPPDRWAPWRRGAVVAVLTALVALAVAVPALVPDTPAHLGGLWETVLPWSVLLVPVAAAAALVRRSIPAGPAALLLLAVWLSGPGKPLITPDPGVEPNLTVVTHNVNAATTDTGSVSGVLLSAAPDLVALEEVTWEQWEDYDAELTGSLPYSVREGTVGLWSRHPIVGAEPVDTGMGWARALRAEVDGPGGVFAVYVVHLASVRMGSSGFDVERRNAGVSALGEAVSREPLERVVLMGDLNASTDDRGLEPLTSRMDSAHEAGEGLGFSWPADFPMVRIDHILTRGTTAAQAWSLPRTGSDHVPVAARLRL